MIHILKIDMGPYEHWALESNSFYRGKPTLISNTRRNGSVQEESWDQVVNGRPYKRIAVTTAESPQIIIARARSAVGKTEYRLMNYNCEHFIRHVLTGVIESKQVQEAVFVVAALSILFALSRKK